MFIKENCLDCVFMQIKGAENKCVVKKRSFKIDKDNKIKTPADCIHSQEFNDAFKLRYNKRDGRNIQYEV